MQCEAIRPLIRTFLDDLLDEKDYQEIQAHLTGCERCHSYAASVGTLSYRLYELGQVSAPLDMASAILYEFQKHAHPISKAPAENLTDKIGVPSASGTRLLWVTVIVVLISAVVAFVTVVSVGRVRKDEPAAIMSQPVRAPISESLTQSPMVIPSESPLGEGVPHWHYHASKSDLPELKSVFSDLYLTVLDESPSHLVFFVPGERIGQFASRMAGLSGMVKEYGEAGAAAPGASSVQVSIYLE